MRNLLFPVLLTLLAVAVPSGARSQSNAAVTFPDYEAYRAFVDARMMKREFGGLMQKLSVTDLSLSQVQELTKQTRVAFPVDFENVALMQQKTLENGFSHELRVYWTDGSYAYADVVLHDRGGEIAILSFGLHDKPGPALESF